MNARKINYVFDSEKKTVVAYIEGCRHDVYHMYLKRFKTIPYGGLFKKLIISNSFRGIAKCDEHDTYNSMVGMEIAKQKLYNKYYKAVGKAITRAEKFIAESHQKENDIFIEIKSKLHLA